MREQLKLYPFQEDGVRFLTLDPTDPRFPIENVTINSGKWAKLLADDMGLGKTVQVIAALNEINSVHAVIVCPATVKIHWARTIHEWSATPQHICILKTGRCKIPETATIIIVNYELLLNDKVYRQLLIRGQNTAYDAVVIDEAHYLKNEEAQRTKRLLGPKTFLNFAFYKWLLTGTPILNRPSEFWPILGALAPQCIHPYLSWKSFTDRYCDSFSEKTCRKCGLKFRPRAKQCHACGGKSFHEGEINTRGCSNPDELAERIRAFMFRRKKEEVLEQLPDVVETVIDVDIPLPPGLETEPIATARRLLAEAKVPSAVRFVSDMMNEVDKVVLFAYHRDVIETLHAQLSNYNSVIIYGGMSGDKKQESIDAFVNDENTRIVIAQITAGGTGVDGLQGVCNHAVFVELDWSPGIMDQAKDRLRRIGQKDTVFAYYLSVPDSLDVRMEDIIDRKRDVINSVVKNNEVKEQMAVTVSEISAAINAITALIQTAESLMASIHALHNGSVSDTIAPAPKAAVGKKAVAKAPDPVVEIAPVQVAAPAGPTEEDFRKAVSLFINDPKFNDQNVSKKIINEQIWPKFGVTSLVEMVKFPDKFGACLEELKKGPAAFYTAPAADNGLDGI